MTANQHLLGSLGGLVRRTAALIGLVGSLVAPPVLRIALALPFLRSGLTRWDGFLSLSIGTQFLFEEQFKLHILGNLYGFPAPDTVAYLVALAEIILPVLLLVGFSTRLVSLALLVMTGVIQLVFPDGWVNFHLYWAALALAIMAIGPGLISLDYLVCRIWRPSALKGETAWARSTAIGRDRSPPDQPTRKLNARDIADWTGRP